MIRVSLQNAFSKRTLRPLLEKHQATPIGINLLSTLNTAATPIYSGMVAAGTIEAGGSAQVATICDAGADENSRPIGLFALDCNPTINDLDGQASDMKPFAVWQGRPDAYFRIDSPAINTTGVSTANIGDTLYSDSTGHLCIAAQASNANWPVGQLIEIVSSTRWVVRLLAPSSGDPGDLD